MNLTRNTGLIVVAILLTLHFGCGAATGTTGRRLVSIEVTPQFLCQGGTLPVPVGAPQKFSATGFFNDNTKQENLLATWSTSDATIATIDQTGKPSCVGQGSVTVSASAPVTLGSNSKVSGTATFACGGRFCP